MALYTSYFAKQLALRPEAAHHQATDAANLEGERTIHQSVARRTVDLAGPLSNWFERRSLIRHPLDTPALDSTPGSALRMLPPLAYAHQPASSFTTKFAQQAPSKVGGNPDAAGATRSSANVVVWTPDGRRCLTGTQGGEFTMWGAQAFQFETILQAHETPVRSMVFTHNGNFLVSGDDSGTVRYWKPNLELLQTVGAHREAVRGVAFSPTDLKYATASDDSTVKVWDFARCQAEQTCAGHGGDVKCVGWHPFKSLLVSASKDGLVKLWCPKSGRALGTMHGHKGTIMAAQWNANGNWVLTASRDQTCKVYDVRVQRELASFRGHNRDVISAAWHPLHEDLFVSGGYDGSLIFWLAGRQAPQAEVRGAHEGSVWAAAWHPSGHLLTTGAADGATKFWCRARPGDPFFEHQQAQQEELAAMSAAADEAAAKQHAGPAAQPLLFDSGAASGAIPGIGEALTTPVVLAPVPLPVPAVAATSAAGSLVDIFANPDVAPAVDVDAALARDDKAGGLVPEEQRGPMRSGSRRWEVRRRWREEGGGRPYGEDYPGSPVGDRKRHREASPPERRMRPRDRSPGAAGKPGGGGGKAPRRTDHDRPLHREERGRGRGREFRGRDAEGYGQRDWHAGGTRREQLGVAGLGGGQGGGRAAAADWRGQQQQQQQQVLGPAPALTPAPTAAPVAQAPAVLAPGPIILPQGMPPGAIIIIPQAPGAVQARGRGPPVAVRGGPGRRGRGRVGGRGRHR
ncbi:hypothetical protein N2152v2_007971 [Parachlorella kessleri]